MQKYAFRCKNCKRLETSDAAGEREYPAACPSCGHGVKFDPTSGVKTYDDAENWTVLADLSAEELEAERTVTKTDGVVYEYWDDKEVKIVKHKAAPSAPATREPQNIERFVEDSIGAEDKVS